jgi:hypothetical protein
MNGARGSTTPIAPLNAVRTAQRAVPTHPLLTTPQAPCPAFSALTRGVKMIIGSVIFPQISKITCGFALDFVREQLMLVAERT